MQYFDLKHNFYTDKKTNSSSPYVVVKIFGLKKTVKKKKTNVVKNNLNPVWNEKMSFDVAGNMMHLLWLVVCFSHPSIVADVRVEALHFTVFDKALFGSEFLGQITVTMKEIATKNNQLDEWLTLDTNHKVGKLRGVF